LPAQEEILGAQGLGRPKHDQQPPEGIFDETTCDLHEVDHALMVPRRSAGARSYREADRDGIFAEYRTRTLSKLAPANRKVIAAGASDTHQVAIVGRILSSGIESGERMVGDDEADG
jgi:hypothetical protein